MKPENQFRSSVHKYFSTSDLYHEKMANPYRAGGADDWYSGKGARSKDLWIEWKFIAVPVRDETVIDLTKGARPDLSALQRFWLESRHAEGRNVAVGIGSKDGGLILWGIDWRYPITAGEFRNRMMSRAELAKTIVSFVKGRT